jgi:hypothetical protein
MNFALIPVFYAKNMETLYSYKTLVDIYQTTCVTHQKNFF